MAGRLRAELLDRLASPFYAFVAGLVGFAALGEARTTRQGRGVATAVAILVFSLLRMVGIAATSLAASRPNAAILVWAVPLGASAACIDAVFSGPVSRVLQGARRFALAATRAS
jgi:lipopolysaccharide export system permease protein